jgi:hypothetical protein
LPSDRFNPLKARLYEKPWIVDVRDPVKNPEHVLEYLARYTHRVAIANSRIRVLKDGMVTFTLRIERKANGSAHDYGCGVHPSLPASQPAQALCAHPALRVFIQSVSFNESCRYPAIDGLA